MKEYLFDIENYPNYLLFLFKEVGKDEFISFERWKNRNTIKTQMPKWLNKINKEGHCVFTYNGNRYDMPILKEWADAMGDLTFEKAQELNGRIIGEDERIEAFNGRFLHGDIQEILNLNRNSTEGGAKVRGYVSMKEAAINIGYPIAMDLPYDPEIELDAAQRKHVLEYCKNDLRALEALVEFARNDMDLRFHMEEENNMPGKLFNRGEPRVARDTMVARYEKKTGVNAWGANRDYWQVAAEKIKKPDWMQFKKTDHPAYVATSGIKFVFKNLIPKPDQFLWKHEGHAKMYETMRDFSRMSGMYAHPDEKFGPYLGYKKESKQFEHEYEAGGLVLGVKEGGLHDYNGPGVWDANGDILAQVDASSFYPYILHMRNLYPRYLPGLGDVYWEVVQDRLRFKRELKELYKEAGNVGPDGDDIERAKYLDNSQYSMKIMINSIYGQLGSIYSPFYDPWGGKAIPLTGELYLIQLIDWFQTAGIEILMANTDGIIIKCSQDKKPNMEKVMNFFQKKYKMVLDVDYLGRFVKNNCNSYILFDEDMRVIKATKDFSSKMAPKRPLKGNVIADAMVAYYQEDKPVEETIRECDDISKFLFVRSASKRSKDVFYDLPYAEPTIVQNTMMWYVTHPHLGGELYNEAKKSRRRSTYMKDTPCIPLLDYTNVTINQLPINRQYYIEKAYEIINQIPKYE